MRPSSLSRHSMLARNGAICSIRLTISEQSLGMPFEMSAIALSDPPVGSVISSFSGGGNLMSAHAGSSKSFCKSADTVEINIRHGVTYPLCRCLNRVVVG